MASAPPSPPLRARAIGTAISYVIALTPRAWPLLAARTERFWDALAGGWDARAAPDRTAPLERACAELGKRPEHVLEIGCGTGHGTAAIARAFPHARITAVDLSAAMVEAAAARMAEEAPGRVSVEQADAASLSFADGSFDLVAQLNMPAFHGEIARVLAPGGHAAFASTLGRRTPYHTPHWLLRLLLRRRGVETVATGTAGRGTYLLARRRDGSG